MKFSNLRKFCIFPWRYKPQKNIYSTTTRYIYLGKFFNQMTKNIFFITLWSSLPFPTPPTSTYLSFNTNNIASYDFRLLPVRSTSRVRSIFHRKNLQSFDDIFYEIATINSAFYFTARLLHVHVPSLPYLKTAAAATTEAAALSHPLRVGKVVDESWGLNGEGARRHETFSKIFTWEEEVEGIKLSP